MNPEILSKFRLASGDSSILVPKASHHVGAKEVDWNAVVLDLIDHRSIGPCDFEKEYLCDMASMGALPVTTSTSSGVSTYGPVTTASTSTGPAMSASDMLKAMEAVIGSDKMRSIMKETVQEVLETPAGIKTDPAPKPTNPDFGSW